VIISFVCTRLVILNQNSVDEHFASVFKVHLDVMLLELIFQLKRMTAQIALVWHKFVFNPLVIDQRAALRKRLAANVALERTQPLVHLHVAAQIEGRATLKAANVTFVRLRVHVVFCAVVAQTRFMDERLAALFARD